MNTTQSPRDISHRPLDRARAAIGLATVLAAAGCSMPAGYHTQSTTVHQQSRAPATGVSYCEDRLPLAQHRIEELYTRISQSSRRDTVSASVTGPDGRTMDVSISSSESGTIVAENVHTGLADMVFNCGADFGERECFIDVYLDGRKELSLRPTTEGRVALRCLYAGTRQLRIESVGEVIFDGQIDLRSDHEHMIQIHEPERATGDAVFEVYAVNPMYERIPPVPTAGNTVAATGDGGTSAAAGASSGGDSVAVSMGTNGEDAPDVEAESSERTHTRTDTYSEHEHERAYADGYRGRAGAERSRSQTDTHSSSSSDRRSRVAIRDSETDRDVRVEERREAEVRSDEEIRERRRGRRRGGRRAEIRAMDDKSFRSLEKSVSEESFSRDKVGAIRASAKHSYFTSKQAAELVGMLSHSANREKVAILLYPRIVDPENFHRVLGELEFSASKKRVREKLDL